MKKITQILAFTLVLVCLSSCAAYIDNGDISKYISPQDYGSLLPPSPPSAVLDPDGSAKTDFEGGDNLSLDEPLFTSDLSWEISGGYFVSAEFTFFIPPQWRDNFEMEGRDRSTGSINWRSFNFYFHEYETDIKVLLLRIDSLNSSFVDSRGTLGGEELARSSDGVYCYLRMANAIDYNVELKSGEAIYNISLALNNAATFDFKVVV